MFVCVEEGCQTPALMCGRPECPCLLPHESHQAKPLVGIIKEAKKEVQLPQEYAVLSKDIDALVDSFIKQLEAARVNHK